MWLPSQRWIVATLRGKFTGKLMTDTTNDKKLGHFVGHSRPKRNAIVEGMGILRRSFCAILVAMHESRQKQAEREIARFFALRGGNITDELEREMNRRLFATDWSRRD
jgi:hypothetical protein